MTGIFFILVVAGWLWLCIVLTRFFTPAIPVKALRPVGGAVLFVALIVLPVIDEIVGGLQFRELCRANARFRVGVEHPENRTAKFSSGPTNEPIPGTAIRIFHTKVLYTDASSGESIVEFDRYVAKGGFLIKALGISDGNAPITIGRPHCSPESVRGESVHLTLKFNVVN